MREIGRFRNADALARSPLRGEAQWPRWRQGVVRLPNPTLGLFSYPPGGGWPAGYTGRPAAEDYGTKTRSRTCHRVLWPGFSVTMPVSLEPHSLPKGSAKLYWCSIATNSLAGGA